MLVNEIFYSPQGEGPLMGTPSLFVRLQGCNLRCNMCDTPYAFNEGKELSTEEVAEKMIQKSSDYTDHIVFTGGEPLLQQAEIIELIRYFDERGMDYKYSIETNGSVIPRLALLRLIDFFIISPKLSNSGVKQYEISGQFFKWRKVKIYIKFVINQYQDLKEVQQYVENNPILSILEKDKIIIMPVTKPHQPIQKQINKLKMMEPFAKENGYRIMPRLHVLLHGHQRGI